jgi:hypothetical protein
MQWSSKGLPMRRLSFRNESEGGGSFGVNTTASKDVKNSSLLSDTLEEQDYMTETLSKMSENRDENRKLLKQKKSCLLSFKFDVN